ncbi:twin-arginine translocase TatA/TatE family subunit [Halorarum halophilum]|uniref:Sec-independent protein translocase protein TatA n=1 Tax=Halorarum halophilum TaxID=2743090 RepID=A0A7D5GAC3_9EURY|nr:twin-arginine translocase TatA/TatE family subunit [Halobaculum halophilum]QLG26486.1 twin-arginine translocase TatA/TatE family subunit [Halobaculum halophilum]
MLTTVPLFGAIPGGPEMLIILLVLVLLFGANKIPKLARSTGQAMGEFKKGREEVEDELQQMQEGATGTGDREEETREEDSEPQPEIGADADSEPEPEIGTETESERN